ncbi:MAG TPA: hypothetical protein VNL39_14555 [Xanthobacteraceae bacterium]|nr:hypothetical protein [Xanthobacteraceae bacterium]
MRGLKIATTVVSAVTIGSGALAQEAAGPSDTARYTFHRAGDAFLRLDVRTGRVSQCGWESGRWFCRAVPDERSALEAEIARLAANNAALKHELLAHGLPLPDGIKPDPLARREGESEPIIRRKLGLERLVGHVEGVWKRLIKMIADLQRDIMRKS